MNKKELKELNFKNLLTLDTDIEKYTFEDYKKNGYKHPGITKMCAICEEEEVNICTSDKNYRLKTMGHGSMTDDFLVATGQEKIDLSDWKNENVLFLLENPGPCDPDIYKPFEYKGFTKFPTHQWYFLNQQPYPQRCEYPSFFRKGEYGAFFTSVLFTFKLKNMYITDIIKCGMNEGRNKFKHISEYNQKCIENCLEHYLYKEIQFVDPKIIFCFGNDVRNKIDKMQKENKLKNSIRIKDLKHPSWVRTKLKRDEIQLHYYDEIFKELCDSEIISNEEEKKYYRERRNDVIEHPDIKLNKLRKFLNEKGFKVGKPHKNYIESNNINGIIFNIKNDESVLYFHWGNKGNKKLDKNWFEQKKNKISEMFPNSILEIGKRNSKFLRLYIPVPYNHDNESILEIINKTKEIMGYQ